MMAYWTFSDVFEEQGVVKQPFYGGFGLIAKEGLPKPSFNAFRLLHQLGDERLALASNSASDSVLATRRRDGTLVVAAWNLAAPGTVGAAKDVNLTFRESGASQVTASRVDPEHGDVHKAYQAMGSPRYPTKAQIQQLRSAAALSAPEVYALKNGSITIKIPAHGLVLLELKRDH